MVSVASASMNYTKGEFNNQAIALTPNIAISLRGITSGRVAVRGANSALVLCGMVCSSWPHWLPFLPSMGLQLEWIYFSGGNSATGPDWLAICCDMGYISGKVQVFDSRLDLVSAMPRLQSRVVFMTGARDTRTLLFPVTSPLVELIFTTGGTRRSVLSTWVATAFRVSHAAFGGVTDHVLHLQCWRPPTTRFPIFGSMPPQVFRDMSTILNSTAEGGRERPAPGVLRVEPPRVQKLAPGLYHGFGHYPLAVRPTPSFLVPSVFTKSKWTRRCLTLHERLLVLDFPEAQGAQLTSQRMSDIVSVAIPGKSLLAVWGVTGGVSFIHTNTNTTSSLQEVNRIGKRMGDQVPTALDTPLKKSRTFTIGNGVESSEPLSVAAAVYVKNEKDAVFGTADVVRHLTATKSDSTSVQTELWQGYLMCGLVYCSLQGGQELEHHLNVLRQWLLRRWKRLVTRSLCWFLRGGHPQSNTLVITSYEKTRERYKWTPAGTAKYNSWWQDWVKTHKRDVEVGCDVIRRTAEATWWTWDAGSACLHWNWPSFYRYVIRDGMSVHFKATPPCYFKPQKNELDPHIKQQMTEKLNHARERGYIGPGVVKSLTSFFAVPKGPDDVRNVYDASVSGLNDVIWVPRFPLPTIATHLRAVGRGTYMADLDVGEMFLNFNLHSQLQEVCGVDLTLFCDGPRNPEGCLHEVWKRAAMGLRSSPYQAVQAMSVAEELILGDRKKPTNIFRWDRIRLNLPGNATYDPSLPWVSKVRTDEILACDLFVYVDDARVTGPTELECWMAARQVSSTLTHLGIQDAARKRRGPRQDPGAWAGAVLRTDGDVPEVQVSEEKWAKTKSQIAEVQCMLDVAINQLPLKRLMQVRGFLLYVTRTYRYLTPYLKGLHLTIDGWRKGRDVEGWKDPTWEPEEDELLGGGTWTSEGAPRVVMGVPRLKEDIAALACLTSKSNPPRLAVRCRRLAAVYYGFGDASGKAFGSTFQYGQDIFYRYGQWCNAMLEESSNYKELGNLVSALHEAVEMGTLQDCEIFLFTDNSTAEGAYYKGNSPSRKLFELVLDLRKLAMDAGLILHVIHVSGKRMIAQGTDGLSRGDHTEGVMQGRSMTEFIPLHLTAFDRAPRLKDWFTLAFGTMDHTFLDPEGWFTTGHQDGNFVWAPPPSATDVVVEQLGKARHKRPNNLHLVVVPRLMTGYWRRMLSRESDGCFEMRLGFELWPISEFEPLIVFVCLPFRSNCPSPLHEGAKLEALLGNLRSKWLWEEPATRSGHFLRELLARARDLDSL
jgi:hypothetical protein